VQRLIEDSEADVSIGCRQGKTPFNLANVWLTLELIENLSAYGRSSPGRTTIRTDRRQKDFEAADDRSSTIQRARPSR